MLRHLPSPPPEVRCPNGGTSYIEQDSILAHQAVRGVSLAPSTAPQHLEYLGRAFDDPNRNLHTPAATFALIASTIGGSVLSLPYAMSQCGFVLGIGMFLVTAVVSGWTLDMLVECARCTGRNTYELVGLVAFGERARKRWLQGVCVATSSEVSIYHSKVCMCVSMSSLCLCLCLSLCLSVELSHSLSLCVHLRVRVCV